MTLNLNDLVLWNADVFLQTSGERGKLRWHCPWQQQVDEYVKGRPKGGRKGSEAVAVTQV